MHKSKQSIALFTYGTLSLPEIMSRVIGKPVPSGSKAILQHFRCNLVSGQNFPAVTPSRGTITTGILYPNISLAELHRLDKYEGPLYKREQVSVSLLNGEEVKAWCYIIRTANLSKLSELPWNLRKFRQNHLDKFL